MKDRLALDCGLEDVIANDDRDYYMREWIEVESHAEPVTSNQ